MQFLHFGVNFKIVKFYSQFMHCFGCTWFVGLFCWFIDESFPYWFCFLVCVLQRCCCLHELLSGEWEWWRPRGERGQERSAGVWTHTWQRCRPCHCSGRVWDQPDACLSCQGQCGLELHRDEVVWLSNEICLYSMYVYFWFLRLFRLWALCMCSRYSKGSNFLSWHGICPLTVSIMGFYSSFKMWEKENQTVAVIFDPTSVTAEFEVWICRN